MTEKERLELMSAALIYEQWRHVFNPSTRPLIDRVLGRPSGVWPDLYRLAYNEGRKSRWPTLAWTASNFAKRAHWWGIVLIWAVTLWNIGEIIYRLMAEAPPVSCVPM
jgi:hypothetical protein